MRKMRDRLPIVFLFLIAGGIITLSFVADSLSAPDKSGADEEFAPGPLEVFIYDDYGKRDPFWRLVTASGAIVTHEKDLLISDMILEGIMTEGDGNNIAIINGRIVKADDAIGAFVIKKIDTDTVILERGKKVFTLKLKKED